MIFKNIPRKLSENPSAVSCKLKVARGFTLVEMMVVISIIGILYLIVFGSVSDSKKRGRDAKRIADISVIQLALERYYDEYKEYPDNLDANEDGFFDGDSSVPTKDSQGVNYVYTSEFPNQTYTLNATLELYNNILSDDADVVTDTNNSKYLEYNVVPKF